MTVSTCDSNQELLKYKFTVLALYQHDWYDFENEITGSQILFRAAK
jgi:hypothetical protein